MGKLYDLIQEHIDAQPYAVSERQVARAIGVTPTTLANWREPKRLIEKKHLLSIARVTRNPYGRVLEALLEDIGYRDANSPSQTDDPPAGNREVRGA